MDGSERISFGQHREALDDRLFVMSFAVEDRAFSFGDHFIASGALPSLAAFAREAELTQISGLQAPIVGTFLVPTKGAGGH